MSDDKWTTLAVVAMGVIGLLGAIFAEHDVPLQFDSDGYTSFVRPLFAALAYPFAGAITLLLTRESPVPWVRWLGRILIPFLLVFEVMAFLHAS